MAETSNSTDKPAVLIVGGLGYIGRFLALYIHQNHLASEVRLVDKVLPQLAWLAPEFSEACSADKFMQADAAREQSLSKIFAPTHAPQYTHVFNCGGETRYSQEDSVYNIRSVALTKALARECARRRIPSYVEFSTGMVYKPPSSSTISSGGCTETSSLKPWLKLAKHKLAAEEALERIRQEFAATGQGELRYAILRLAHVYGDYDVGFLARGLCLARVYQSKAEEMKWLYGRELRINTVHVLDCVAAAWLAAQWGATVTPSDPELRAPPQSPASPSGFNAGLLAGASARAFNVADSGDTSQAMMATIVHELFDIPTGFQNTLVSTFARFNLDSVVDDVNEDVLQPWADLLAERGITRPGPIGPFMEKELLRD
ncbi:MAG: hypothetical protein LQ340_003986, partial [Diploschistes diacapsis]